MTEEQLHHWRKVCEEATAGPWHHDYQPQGPSGSKCYRDQVLSADGVVICQRPYGAFRGPGKAARNAEIRDARFIAMAREMVPALLDEVGRLRAALSEIWSQHGNVCPEYETCDHTSCQSSYAAWAIADRALRKEPGQ